MRKIQENEPSANSSGCETPAQEGLITVAASAREHTSSERAPARRLRALTSLRFVAAAGIVIHHLAGVFGVPESVTSDYPLANGVSFFFVLSGFILTYAYSGKELNAREFILAR